MSCARISKITAGTDMYRVLDANFNRAKEGLRVCEEIARFHLRSTPATKKLRTLRHQLTDIFKTSGLDLTKLIMSRDSKKDLGKDFSSPLRRASFRGIFMANAQRIKESLRVLEEFLKIINEEKAQQIQTLRFAFYDLEKKIIKQCPGLLDPR